MLDPEPLILVGSSVRAAAQSAVRAGFSPWCVDQFGDRDLTEIAADVQTVLDWPAGIEAAFRETPAADWLYTGALENDSELVGRLSDARRLLGCGPDVLRCIRDPRWLAHTLTKASLPSLPVIVSTSDFESTMSDKSVTLTAHSSEQWILKPQASAAGLNIRDFELSSPTPPDLGRYFLQKKATGRSISGVFLGAEGAEGRQLKGLFGIDFIFDKSSGELWTLEVNPRYPASAELYERALGWPMIRWHVDACRRSVLPSANYLQQVGAGKSSRKHGKLIVYAKRDFAAPDIVPLVKRLPQNGGPEASVDAADIPQLGILIRKDEPVCTLLTAQENLSTCHEILLTASDELLAAIDAIAN